MKERKPETHTIITKIENERTNIPESFRIGIIKLDLGFVHRRK